MNLFNENNISNQNGNINKNKTNYTNKAINNNHKIINRNKNNDNIDNCDKNKKDKKPILIGLNNIGATCYMNATLQCFSNTNKLTEYFLNEYKYELIRKIKLCQMNIIKL